MMSSSQVKNLKFKVVARQFLQVIDVDAAKVKKRLLSEPKNKFSPSSSSDNKTVRF